jgi:hypothetical protein
VSFLHLISNDKNTKIMKTIKLFLLLMLFSFLLFSCSKSNSDSSDSSDSTATKVIGTWKMSSSNYNGMPQSLDACELMETLVITSTQLSSTEFSGVGCGQIETIGPVKYTLNGNIVAFTFNSVSYVYKIIVTETTLTIIDDVDPMNINQYIFKK